MKNRFIIGYCVIFLGIFGVFQPVWARVMEKSSWESDLVPDTVLSVAAGDVNGDGHVEIVYLTEKELVLTDGTEKLNVLQKVKARSTDSFHRLWLGDFNADGNWDLLVNFSRAGSLLTLHFQFDGLTIKKIKDYDSLFVPLYLSGQWHVFAQTLYDGGKFSRATTEMDWDGRVFKNGEKKFLKAGVGQNGANLLALTGMDGSFAEFGEDNHIRITDLKGVRLFKTGMRYGGAYDFIKNTSRDSLGLNNQERVFISPRSLYNPLQNTFYVIRNEGYLKSVIGAIPSMKSSTISRLDWDGQRLREVSSLPRHDGAITDIQFVDFDGDGNLEILAVLLVRKLGYLDSLRKQSSVIVLIPLDTLK